MISFTCTSTQAIRKSFRSRALLDFDDLSTIKEQSSTSSKRERILPATADDQRDPPNSSSSNISLSPRFQKIHPYDIEQGEHLRTPSLIFSDDDECHSKEHGQGKRKRQDFFVDIPYFDTFDLSPIRPQSIRRIKPRAENISLNLTNEFKVEARSDPLHNGPSLYMPSFEDEDIIFDNNSEIVELSEKTDFITEREHQFISPVPSPSFRQPINPSIYNTSCNNRSEIFRNKHQSAKTPSDKIDYMSIHYASPILLPSPSFESCESLQPRRLASNKPKVIMPIVQTTPQILNQSAMFYPKRRHNTRGVALKMRRSPVMTLVATCS